MEMLGVKETVAAAGVTPSLLFAFRNSAKKSAVRSATIQGIAEQSFDYSLTLVQDTEWMRIMATLSDESVLVEDLDAVDRTRLVGALISSIRIMESRFRQMQVGIIDSADIRNLGGTSNRNWSSATSSRSGRC